MKTALSDIVAKVVDVDEKPSEQKPRNIEFIVNPAGLLRAESIAQLYLNKAIKESVKRKLEDIHESKK